MKKTLAISLAIALSSSIAFASDKLTQDDVNMLFKGKISKDISILSQKEMKDTQGKALSMPQMPSIGGVGGEGTAIEMPSIGGVSESGSAIAMPEMPSIGGVGREGTAIEMPEMPSIGGVGGL
jgi:hypothetical protein